MEHKTHYFFAISIPIETKNTLKEHCEILKEKMPFSRWVHHMDLHITLAFLGFAPNEELEMAIKNVKYAIHEMKTFDLQINQLGVFGRMDQPRVLWADTAENRDLKIVRNKVFTACENAGFKLETREFRPHITLARKWAGEQAFEKDYLDLWGELQPVSIDFEAKNIVLYKTNLHKTPKYEPIVTFPLIQNIK